MTTQETVKHGIDAVAVAAGPAAYLDYAPNIAAVLSALWLATRLWDWIYAKLKKPKE